MAADVEGVERLLEELHRVKDEDFPDSEINDPAALVEQLSKAVLAVDVNSAGNEADISLFSSFMFSSRSPRDMLSFVTATINRDPKGTKKARMAALSAVADFIKHVKDTPNLDRYAVTIKQGVWEVFAKETLSHEVRSRALKPLRQLLKLRPPSLAASKWEVTDMWITIQEQYRLGSSKSSQGVRGELLKLAGVLLLVYGEHVPDLALGVDTVLSWCDFTLNEHASNKKRNKKLEPQVVAGSLACIDLVCAAGFEARYSDGVGENTKNTALYTHLLKAAADGTAEGLTRYEVAAKALRFFRRHAILFADNVGPLHRALQLYEIMEKCASAGSSSGSRLKLKKHALPGIEAIIGVVSHYAAHSGNRSVQKETVLKFEGMWLGLVEGGDPTKEETTVALAGLAAISPAATALCSYQEAIDVADRLLVCLDSALGRLDSLGILDNDGDSEEEDSADGVTAATGSSNNSYAKRDRSIRLKAQYLRTLACRAGVLGGIAAKKHREGAEMDVEEGTHSRAGVRVETSSPGVAGAGIPGHLLRRLATLATHLVEKYAMLVHQDRALACRGLCQLWVSLSGPGQGDNLSHALAAVVPKGVVRAAAMEDTKSGGVSRGDSGEFGGEDESSKPPHGIRWIAPVDPVTGEADTRLCFLYADMWRRLLDPGEDDLENFVVAGATGGLGVRGYGRTVAPEVYDAMLSSILSVVKRLDLRYETSDEGGRPHPLQPTDQQLFLNLVSFCQELLPRCRPDLLLEWAPLLCPELVERSLERPLVSGFYRLITLVFREASRTGYFDPPPPPCNEVATPDIKIELATPGSVVEAIGKGVDGSGERSRDDDRNVCVDAEEGGTEQGRVGGADGRDGGRSICRRVLCRYLEWMTVRLSGFRDELLAACIEALLSAPIGLLDGDLRPLVPALKLALASGSSHLPTAIAAITALERWNEDRSTVLRPHLGEVLPHLDRYLSSEASTASESGSTEKARRSKGKKKTSAAAAAIAATGDHGEESQRKDLRRRVVRFLGRLGGRNQLMASDASLALSDSLAWDTVPRIFLEVPYRDQMDPLTVCMDGVLQRLVVLARHEGARQTKTLAAECLHALVVYMVGCTATDPSSGQRGRPGDFSKLFRRVYPAVLRLAVDLDETTRTLFSKLSMQLVRWFSQAQTDNDDTLALLDCLAEEAAAEEGGPLRELCARGVVEFLRYAIKQSSKRQQAEGPVAVDALLTRVFSLATHPDKNRRLGGLMAFNQLCRPLREETALVDRYALRLLHVAMVSLRRAHHDHSALGVADAASAAVDRSLRIIHHSVAELGDRADLLKPKNARGQLSSVQEMAQWAWDEVGAVETRFRRKCMAILLALCPLVVGTPGLPPPPSEEGTREWIWKCLKSARGDGVTEAVRVFEKTRTKATAAADPAVVGGADEGREQASAERNRCELIATAADCYQFACETGVITPDELFLQSSSLTSSGDCTSDQEGKSAGGGSSKKRKVGDNQDEQGMGSTPPRVLRSLAVVMERYGKFLRYFPFQSLVDGDDDGGMYRDKGKGKGEASRSAHDFAPKPLLDDPGALPPEREATRLARAVLIRRAFNLMAACLSGSDKPNDMAAVLVREGLWGEETQRLVVYSLAWPWAGGLLPRASDGDEVGKFLPAAAERLLSHWKILDRNVGEGSPRLYTILQDLLRLQNSNQVAESSSMKITDSQDLCQWLLSSSLSSHEALSRPSLDRTSSTGMVNVAELKRLSDHRHPPPDDELTGRVVRAYRAFARAGIFDTTASSGATDDEGWSARSLAFVLWFTILSLPEGLRPASAQRASAALRLSIELGLPTIVAPRGEISTDSLLLVPFGASSGSPGRTSHEACLLQGLLDVSPAAGGVQGGGEDRAGKVGGATKGALLYRRFPDIVHEVLLKAGDTPSWPEACAVLVEACLSDSFAVAPQAFRVLEGVLDLQLRRATGGVRFGTVSPSETLKEFVPQFRRLVNNMAWGPPAAGDEASRGSNAATARMLRESLRLCHRLLRLMAATSRHGRSSKSQSPDSNTTQELLKMSSVLAAGTIGSVSPRIDPAAKADALALVPFLRPCLTRRAEDYGHLRAGHDSSAPGDRPGGGHDHTVLLALEEMIARHFPIEDSREPVEGSEEATAFALLLRSLLAVFVRCGDLSLLELLFGTLAEGRKHLYYRWISRALDGFVAGLDLDADGVAETVFGFCLDNIATGRIALNVKAGLFDKVCLPILRRCPTEISRALYLSTSAGGAFRPRGAQPNTPVLQRLSAVTDKRSKDTGKFLAGPFLAACCFALIEALYEMFEKEELKSLAEEAFGTGDVSLKQLTTTIAKAWKAVKECAGRAGQEDGQPWVELRSRRAAFSCVCAVVCATQEEEKHFNNIVWNDKLRPRGRPGDNGSDHHTNAFSLLMDTSKDHDFEVSPPYFHTTPLHPSRPPPALGAIAGVSRAVKRKPGHVLTASSMLSQSSLAVAGVDYSSIARSSSDSAQAAAGRSEDARETYSSQAALAEPSFSSTGGAATDKNGGRSQSQSLSQEDTMSPVFERGLKASDGGVRQRGWGRKGSAEGPGGQGVVLELSHINQEPCMRSLLLVVETELRLFGEAWRDRVEESLGVYEPEWSAKMRAKLADPDLPKPVRLLAFQFALNAPATSALQPWARPWIIAMTDFVLSPLPEGIRRDGEKGLHYLLRDFAHVLLDADSGWGGVVRKERKKERQSALEMAAGDIVDQPLLNVGNRLVSHLMSVASFPEGKKTMLRANMELVAGLIGLFGDPTDAVHDHAAESDPMDADGERDDSRRNELCLNMQYIVDMLGVKEGHTGGAHASAGSSGVRAKHTILTGLNLLGILFQRRVPVLVDSVAAANNLARALPLACLSYVQKNTFETGTELLAMALAHVSWLKNGNGMPPGDNLCTQCQAEGGEWLVRKVIERLIRMGREGGASAQGRYLHAVSTIVSFYPPVLTRSILLSSLMAIPRAEAVFRGRFVATLADAFPGGEVPHLEEPTDLFTRLQPLLPSLLLEPEVEFIRGAKEAGGGAEWIPLAQLSALRLVRALIPTLTSRQLGTLLGDDDAHSLVGLATPSTFRACREVAYATLLDLHFAAKDASTGKHPREGARGGAALTQAQRETVRCALLRGLSDPDDEGMTLDDQVQPTGDEAGESVGGVIRRGIRRRLFDVFDVPPGAAGGSEGLNEAPGQRLLSLMRDMFDRRTARTWLRFAPCLLLRPAEQAPGYHAKLFKKGLLDCQFVDMPIAAGAGGLDARPMEPAFSFVSLSSQNEAPVADGGYAGNYGTLTTDIAERKAGMVRATQNYLWSQTQAPGGMGGGAGAGSSSGGSGARAPRGASQRAGGRGGGASVHPRHVAFPSQTQSKMLARPALSSQEAMPPPTPRARARYGGVASQGGGGGVGRRFRKTSGGSMSSMKVGQTHAMQRRMAAKREREKASRARRAVIYRKYRDGELPDIQIKLGDVLRPLQHLSMLDGGIAKEVFLQIFKGVYAGLPGSANATDEHGTQEEAVSGEGRRAVAVLLQKMLSAAKNDTEVVSCLHAACRSTADAPSNNGVPPTPRSGGSAQSRTIQGRRGTGQQQGRGRALLSKGTGGSGSRASSQTHMRGSTAGVRGKEDLVVGSERGKAIALSPGLVADTAIASLNIHSGIIMLEEGIMRSSEGRDPSAAAAATVAAATKAGGRRRSRGGGAYSIGSSAAKPIEGPSAADIEAQQDWWLQLSRLYAALGERDMLVGVAARASRLPDTRRALEAELSGDFKAAKNIYVNLLKKFETRFEEDSESVELSEGIGEVRVGEDGEGAEAGKVGASMAELAAWDMRQLECRRQLGEWEGIRKLVVMFASEDWDSDEDSEQLSDVAPVRLTAERQRRVWAIEPPARRDEILPYFVWSIVHDAERAEVDLKTFLEGLADPEAPAVKLSSSSDPTSASNTVTRLTWLETNMPGELAVAFLLVGQLGRTHQYVSRCYDRFQEKWAGLHACAEAARQDQLRGLQLVVEVEDFLSFNDKESGAGALAHKGDCIEGRVRGLLARWARQAPSCTLDPVTTWGVMLTHRHDCFRAVEASLTREGACDDEAVKCKREMLRHRGELSLDAAGAAIAQGVLDVAVDLITSYPKIKRVAKELGTSTEGQQEEEAMAGGDSDWDLGITLRIAEFNAVKMKRLRLEGSWPRKRVLEKLADRVKRTLKPVEWCLVQQQAAIRKATASSSTGKRSALATVGGGGTAWVEANGWEVDGPGAIETRLRLLALRGEWLEAEGRILQEQQEGENTSCAGSGRKNPANSFTAALASLEEAAELGDEVVSSPAYSVSRRGIPTGDAGYHSTSTAVIDAAGEAMLKLALLCETLATRKDGAFEGGSGSGGIARGREALAALSVKRYLSAMSAGSAQARERFPRVLFLVGEFRRAREAFAEGAPSIPEWTFLRWVSQMLGVTGRAEGPVVLQVLERVARVYPRALFYPLLITKTSTAREQLEGKAGTAGGVHGGRLGKLTALTFDPSAEAFAEALRGLHHPELRYMDSMKQVMAYLGAKQPALARMAYVKMREECLVIDGRKTGDKVGQYNRDFAKSRAMKIDKDVGIDGRHLDMAKCTRWLKEGKKWMRERNRSSRMPLSSFSTWMSDFDSNAHLLEVPGQYGGISEGPPRVSHHSRIVSFGSELLVMPSLRVPKRLTIHADDEKDHMFLVKGGEDLRVDERVEQLFEVMNAIMAKSASCSRARLANKTYKVIPVTPDVGLIEWVQNTRPLKGVIEDGIGMPLQDLPGYTMFQTWLGGDFEMDKFHKMFTNTRRDEVEANFAERCASVPTDILRRHLLKMAPSPEAFLTCRGGFARSLATLSACCYVMGIGDRHLDNFLLDTTTGTVIGIDFGAAFGHATSELPVPEFLPFRLTNQFQNLLQPLDSIGLLKGHMMSTLQALRGGREVLLSTMDVFLNEPVIDWLKVKTEGGSQAVRKGDSKGDDGCGNWGGGSQPRVASEAGRRMNNARRKLEGEHPAVAVINDLEQNQSVKRFRSLDKLKGIVWGDSGRRVRSRPEHRRGPLSVADQVECLIDLATDPDILGRQWIGLVTWV